MLEFCPVAAFSTYSEYDVTHTAYINDCCINIIIIMAFIIVIAAYMIAMQG